MSARRSVSDYLRDYRAGRVSYRELDCDDTQCREIRRELPMQLRDRVEFAWHIVRFLMQNFLKLVRRRNEAIGKLNSAAAVEERKRWARQTFWDLIGGPLERCHLHAMARAIDMNVTWFEGVELCPARAGECGSNVLTRCGFPHRTAARCALTVMRKS